MKMGCGSNKLLTIMVFIIIIITTLLMLPSSQRSTHILSVGGLMNAAGSFHIHRLPENEKQVKKISGLDENEEKQALIVEKFRSLLGLKSFHTRVPSTNGDSSEFLSPSPSPSQGIEAESPSPSPSPVLHHLHPHPHHPRHHSYWNHPPSKTHHEDRGRAKRILVAVLVSVVVAALIGVCGLILVCRKLTNQKKKPKRTMPLCTTSNSKGVTTRGTYQNSANKVSLNSGLDLFYLDALGEDIEQHACSLKEKTCCKNNGSECGDDNVSCSSTKEIVSVHDDEKVEMELVKREPELSDDGNSSSCGDKIIPEDDCHSSSDNESFHSFVDSQISNARLSNASDGSLSDTHSQNFPTSPQNSISNTHSHQPPQHGPKHEDQEVVETSFQCQKPSTSTSPPPPPPTPPPPPPPLPPLQMPLFSLHSLTCSSRVSSPSPLSLTSHTLSSPINSDTFSGSNNQSPEKELLSPLPPPPPPNPTKSPPNIPPPPCPPPFLKGNSNNSAKTPPPPPSQFTPLGKDGAPLPKLKPLHWDKVRAAPNRTMVWDKLRSSSFEFDEEMIESLFGYNLQNTIKNDEAKSKTPSPSKHVLEPKRLQNITILSKALNATAEQVCQALMQGKGLSLQQLEALVKMVPTKEEESKLFNYKGDINELGSAEKFVRSMLSVPFAFQRVESMLYKETFDDEVVHLRNSFSMLEEACKELRSSRLFLKLLEAVLKTGNRMNVGTIRGGARAFKLDALLKLADVKGTDGKTTLLHFVVQEIVRSEGIRVSDSIMGKISISQKSNKNRTEEEKEEDYRRMGLELVSGLSTELYNVKKTATIDLDVLASSVSNLSEGMARLQHLVEKELHGDERSHEFVQCMRLFLNYVDGNLKELQGDEDRVLARVKEITEYFHGDGVISKEDANPLRIFVIVRDFLGMLDNVCKELRRSKASRSPNPLAPFR